MRKRYFVLLFLAGWILAGCSASPLDEGVSSTTIQSVTGTVTADPADGSEGVYIWLEGTSISTRSDMNGDFEITLPQQNSGGFDDGIFNLHFYLANYGLESASVVLKDGAFATSKGDVNGIGALTSTKRLSKLLEVRTDVQPDLIDEDFSGVISVSLSLRAVFDSVRVSVPKLLSQFTHAIIFKSKTGDVLTIPSEDDTVLLPNKIGPEESLFNYDFEMTPGLFPTGDYEIIPFFLIEQDELPSGLLESMGPDVVTVGPSFLKLPFKREGGRFVIHE